MHVYVTVSHQVACVRACVCSLPMPALCRCWMGGSGGVAGIVRDDRALSALSPLPPEVTSRCLVALLELSGVSSRSGVVGGADSDASVNT